MSNLNFFDAWGGGLLIERNLWFVEVVGHLAELILAYVISIALSSSLSVVLLIHNLLITVQLLFKVLIQSASLRFSELYLGAILRIIWLF